MVALAVVIAALILIALLRFGVFVEYGEVGIRASASIGFIKVRIFPRKVKEKKRTKKRVSKKVKEKPAEKVGEKPGLLRNFKEMLPAIKKASGRLRRRLLIKKLTVHYIAGGTDAAMTALSFGASNAVFGLVVPVLENSFRVKERDLRSSADFNATEPYIYVSAAISLAVWEAVYIMLGVASAVLGKSKDEKKPNTSTERKEYKNGKAPDR